MNNLFNYNHQRETNRCQVVKQEDESTDAIVED